MAKARVSINPLYTGGAGGYSFYVRKDEQIVRQRKNNSNYGETASRSLAQQVRRVKWANLVNVFKACKDWMPKAYESKQGKRTDYNEFMSVNIGSARVCLTKDQAANGCAVVDAFQISKGSLPPITLTTPSSGADAVSDIAISTAITSSTTIGALAADIIANNPQFKSGDNIALVAFSQFIDSRSYPYISTFYGELTLDPTNTALFSTLPISNFIDEGVTTSLAIQVPGSSFGAYRAIAMIHTRMSSPLQVSSQQVLMLDSSILEQFIGYQWEQTCIATYGVDQEVPLDPSFKYGTITSVTANSVEIHQGDILQGQQTIRVYGSNLYASNFKFVANNVEYVPLEIGNGYQQYSITANADISLMLNGGLYLSFRVTGIVTPSELTGHVRAFQRSTAAAPKPGAEKVTYDGCLNYNVLYDPDYPQFRVLLYYNEGESITESDITPVNATLSAFNDVSENSFVAFSLMPIDTDSPIYCIYKGFIFFVGNYS